MSSRTTHRFLLAGLLIVAAWLAWRWWHPPSSFAVFDRGGAGSAIVVPAAATPEELAAAELVRETLAAAAGSGEVEFPIVRERWWNFWVNGVFIGETRHAREIPWAGTDRLDRSVAMAVRPFGVVLRARWREDIAGAAGWFLEKKLGARWFMPGPLGASVPARETLRLPFGVERYQPSFVSRSLGGLDHPAEERWSAANRLRGIFRHYHAMSDLFKPEDLAEQPDLEPLLSWQKFTLTRPNDPNWQPNIAAPAAAAHAIDVIRHRFDADPNLLSVSVAMNDSIRYDQSETTQKIVGGPRWFRHKPDYSDLVFGFANQVAKGLQAEFPDHFVTTYAYDWTEQVPRFKVEPNVVPYLTADRAQWFDPAFAAEDRDLIQRWIAAGPKVVGLYDYYEGAPFLVPKPVGYAVAQSIPFAHAAGVRAFYAEASTNWGLDGPKCWLAAQLLWDASQDPAKLLDDYYREFWQEAAGPMREFFATCDRQWLEQPLPSYWLKYFKDDDQHLLYPAAARAKLRGLLNAARQAAASPVVRERVEFVSEAFGVTEAFCAFGESRDALSRLTLADRPDAAGIVAAARAVQADRHAVEERIKALARDQPLAVRAKLMEEYTRNDPRRRALWRLWPQRAAAAKLAGFDAAFGDLVPILARHRGPGPELNVDGELTKLTLREVDDFTALDWVKSGYWQGHGEPYETRRITLVPVGDRNSIRFEGCKQETLSQWHSAEPGDDYIGTVKVRAKVSPGNMTFLIVTMLDDKGGYLGIGNIDRVPVGDWREPVELAVFVHAPENVKNIGLGVRVLNQVDGDYAEFSDLSLRKLE
ncbi:MAG TPA: DUF4838 domain-containing protein [Lacunisphaera sp.]|nr:DUF4838 domain-containing protein [Lacunisphaera sp.]